MLFTPEDLETLEPFFQKAIEKNLYRMQKQIELLQADIKALRSLVHAGVMDD